MAEVRERSSERVRVDAFVKVMAGEGEGDAAAGERGQELVFRTRDLSEHGLFLYTRVARAYPFKIGSTLSLELYDFDDYVKCKVVVVRVVENGSLEAERFPTGFGVRILDCSEPGRAVLTQMIGRIRDGATAVY
jgi:PilZ domain